MYLLTPQGRKVYAFFDGRFPIRHIRQPSEGSYPHQFMLTEIALAISGALSRRDPNAHVHWDADWEVVERLGTTRVIPDGLLIWELDKNL